MFRGGGGETFAWLPLVFLSAGILIDSVNARVSPEVGQNSKKFDVKKCSYSQKLALLVVLAS